MKNLKLFSLVMLIFILVSCNDKNENINQLSLEKVNGYVQKGPYLNGTPITIYELSQDLVPTGRDYSSQILDNKGTFEIKNVDLSSQFVELKADGFYFNEVTNANSSAQLTLFALSDLTNKSTINVNVLSTIEKGRVEFLISNGSSFTEAKRQAQSEILKIFEITKPDIAESENLDISQQGDDNAILLAISVVLQGYLTVPDLSELLANISTDIREDGELNSKTLGSMLINNAKVLKLDEIRKNLENRYETLGLNVTIPDFEKYVNQFIDSTDFEFTGFIEYPSSGKYGLNLLDKTRTEYSEGSCSLNAILPEGTSLKVKVTGFNFSFYLSQDNPGWERSGGFFNSVRTGEIDFACHLERDTTSERINIFVYENGADDYTWTKEITVN